MDINEVRKLAQEKMIEHGLVGWQLKMVNSLSFAGRCWRSKRLLELSIDFMEVYDYNNVMDTILHEIAHALDTTRYKTITTKHGYKKKQQLHHDEVWKKIARSIGCSAMRCVDPKAPKPIRVQTARYKGICPNGHEVSRQRLGENVMTGSSCGKCNKTYDPKYRYDWYDNGRLIHQQPKATATVTPSIPVVRIPAPPKPVKTVKPAAKPVRTYTEEYWTDTPEGIAALKSLLS